MKSFKHTGIVIALLIITLWFGSTYYCLAIHEVSWQNPVSYLLFFIQSHLYTGLFITAHDSMHGVVSRNKTWNEYIGRVCTSLFAFNFYDNLFKKHHLHHRYVATEQDPDYHGGNFWIWYGSFASQYVNIWQIVMMAVAFNLLIIAFPEPNVLLLWAFPSIVSTFQLFYFGTYLPHKGEHDNIHQSRSQKRNHLWAFLSCYFFGYHYEHHALPNVPWWLLANAKDKYSQTKH